MQHRRGCQQPGQGCGQKIGQAQESVIISIITLISFRDKHQRLKGRGSFAINNVIKEGVQAGGGGSGANPPSRVGDAIGTRSGIRGGDSSLIEVGVSGGRTKG